MTKTGDIEGTNLFVRLAGVTVEEPDGSVSDAVYTEFMSDIHVLIERITGSVQNTAVLCALFLTIAIPLLVQDVSPRFGQLAGGAESSTYTESGAASSAAAGGDAPPHRPSGPPPRAAGAFAETAEFLAQGDEAVAARVRMGFHAVEMLLVTLLCAASLDGAVMSAYQYICLTQLPSELHTLTYMVEYTDLQCHLSIVWNVCVMLLALAVPFLAARVSAVGFFCGLGAVGLFMHFVHKHASGCFRPCVRLLHEEATEALERGRAERFGGQRGGAGVGGADDHSGSEDFARGGTEVPVGRRVEQDDVASKPVSSD